MATFNLTDERDIRTCSGDFLRCPDPVFDVRVADSWDREDPSEEW